LGNKRRSPKRTMLYEVPIKGKWGRSMNTEETLAFYRRECLAAIRESQRQADIAAELALKIDDIEHEEAEGLK